MADITVKLKGTVKQIAAEMLKQLNVGLAHAIKLAAPLIQRKIRLLVEDTLRSSPTLMDLTRGDLRGQMGLPAAKAGFAVESIIRSISSTIEVVPHKGKLKSKGGINAISIEAQPAHFQNLTNLPQGTQRYFSSRYKRMVDLKWLDWLLFEGDRIIVGTFHFEGSNNGRSGLGTMKTGGSFRVPPYYAGTANSNFVTRAFSDSQFQSKMQNIIKKSLEKHWK